MVGDTIASIFLNKISRSEQFYTKSAAKTPGESLILIGFAYKLLIFYKADKFK